MGKIIRKDLQIDGDVVKRAALETNSQASASEPSSFEWLSVFQSRLLPYHCLPQKWTCYHSGSGIVTVVEKSSGLKN